MSAPLPNTGRNFVLGDDLRIQSSSSHGGPSTGLVEDASRKHIATYSQPVEGPLELSTMQAMARTVHDKRALPGQKSPPLNTVAIFHESALPTPVDAFSDKRTVNGKALDVHSGTVFNTTKDKSVAPTHVTGVDTMFFDKENNNNHFRGFAK